MPQIQREILIHFLDGNELTGAATGNNAAWICHCSRKVPLLGFSAGSKIKTTKPLVECPECKASYVVVAKYPQGRPTKIVELEKQETEFTAGA
jgi:hypothetical protein